MAVTTHTLAEAVDLLSPLTEEKIERYQNRDPNLKALQLGLRVYDLNARVLVLEGAANEVADGSIAARRLVAIDATGDLVQAGVNATNVIGINAENEAKEDTDDMIVGYSGKRTGIAADDIDEGRPLKSYYGGKVGEMVDTTKAGTTIDTGVGLAFTNQPANDGVEIVSDDAADDDTVTVTIYGTRNGQGDTLYKEEIALDGTTPVSTVITDWSLILGVEIDAEAVGTVTFREASGNAAITTITAGNTSSGVVAVPDADQRAFGVPPTAVAEDATTKQIGLVGISTADGTTEVLDSQALAGATAQTMNLATFLRVTKLLVGDLEGTRTLTVAVGAAEDRERRIGKSIGAATAADQTITFNLQV